MVKSLSSPGVLTLALGITGTYIQASHTVDPSQYEPGVASEDQADVHDLSFYLQRIQLAVTYRILSRLGLDFQLPIGTVVAGATFIDKKGEELPGFKSIHHRNETIYGVGDVSLVADIGVIAPTDKLPFQLDFKLGLQFPTGEVESDPFVLGEQGKAHQHVFFGTGTFNPILGLTMSYDWTRASLVGWTRLTLHLYANSKGYQGPTMATGGLGLFIKFPKANARLLLGSVVEHQEPARWSSRPAENSGRTTINASVGGYWNFASGLSTFVVAHVQAANWVHGGQLDLPVTLEFGIRTNLSLREAPAHGH